ncbi:hypothetical protein [Streptomyces sp. NPDC058701]|uniref:hypothetical protein n=1 Tax=Streptomyces sp. NPDC058701 TaxID=3346608 RepID=UPI003664ABB7
MQAEVTAALASPSDFEPGPVLPPRDTAAWPGRGFVVRDGDYVFAHWPDDCHRLAQAYLAVLRSHRSVLTP